jgi:hypothetical protein
LSPAAVTGCENDVGNGRPYSVEYVQKTFEVQTGDKLRVEQTSHGVPVLGDVFALGVAPQLKSKYGDFAAVVFDRLGRWKRSQLDGGRRPGKDGIVWTYHPGENEGDVPSWSAGKYYRNVVLTWYHPTRETNEQWERLDRASSALGVKRL